MLGKTSRLLSAGRAAASIEVTPDHVTLGATGTQQIMVVVRDRFGGAIGYLKPEFVSQDENICTVDANGIIEGIAPGSTTITIRVGELFFNLPVEITGSGYFSEIDLAAGGDGTGTKLVCAHVARDFVRNANNEVTAAPSSFGISAPMTIVGVPKYDPVLDAVYNDVAQVGGVRLFTDDLNELDMSEPLTLICIGRAIQEDNAHFYCGITGAAGHIGIRRHNNPMNIMAQFDPAPAGQAPNVDSGVPTSGSMRLIFAQTDGGTNSLIHIPEADPVSGSHSAYWAGPAKLVWFSVSDSPAATSAALAVAATFIIRGYLTDQQREAIRTILKGQFPLIEDAPAPGGGTVDHVVLNPSALTLTLGNSYQVQGEAQDSGNNPLPAEGILYETSDPDVFTVDPFGNVTPVGLGSATLTARAASDTNITDTCAVTIEAAVATHVNIVEPAVTVPLSQTRDVNVVVRDQSVADGQDIGFVMTSGYSLSASSDTPGVATAAANGLTKVTVTSVAQGSAVVTATVDGSLTDTVNVTVPAVATAGVYHLADEEWFGDYRDRRMSASLPLTTGPNKTFFWHCQQYPMRAVDTAPGQFRAIHGLISHFTGNQCSFVSKVPIALLDGSDLPAMQVKLRFAARVTNSQANLRIAPVLYVENPNTGQIRGYLYDPVFTPPGGLGNAFAVGNSLVGREVAFTTAPLAGMEHGDLLCLELFVVGTATYTGLGNPRTQRTYTVNSVAGAVVTVDEALVVNQWVGGRLSFGSQNRTVVSNDASSFTLSSAFSPQPSAGQSVIASQPNPGLVIGTSGWTPSTTVLRAGDAFQLTSDESFRPDWRIASDATTDANGDVNLVMSDTVTKYDGTNIFPMWGFFIGMGGSTTPVEGVVNSDPSFEIEFDQALPVPAASTVAHIQIHCARPCVWLWVGGPTWDCSDVTVWDSEGNDITASFPPSFASNDTDVCTVHPSTGVVTPVGAGFTTITVTAGGVSRDFNVRVLASEHGTTVNPIYLARSFDSIATNSQPAPDNNTRVAPNGSDGWDNIEANSFGAGAGAQCTRATPNAILGWYGGSGLVNIDPDNEPTHERRCEARAVLRAARSAPFATSGGRSIHRAKFVNHIGGVSPGVQQTIQGGAGSIPMLNWNDLEIIQFLYWDEHAMHHPIIQKIDYLWDQISNHGTPNYIFGLKSSNGGVAEMQQRDHTTTAWRFFFRGQGHPEDNLGGGVPRDPGATVRPDYDCNVPGEGFYEPGTWVRVRIRAYLGSGPGQDDGVFQLWLDKGDAAGETLCMNITNVRFIYSDATTWRWYYIQRTAIIGGGFHPVIRRPFSFCCDNYTIGGQIT